MKRLKNSMFVLALILTLTLAGAVTAGAESEEINGTARFTGSKIESTFDSGKIAEHLNRLLTEPEFASSISQNAQERFFREFTETKMVGEYEKIFLRLLGK